MMIMHRTVLRTIVCA